ncbi:MAG: hypothetical protein M5U12_29585 [Verrucomicrobia bacterium]|nr:hypothetical protein [Verrucomicrobiota bacterium]
MQNLPERGPSGVTDLELAALDLRYEGYRLRQPRREAALLAAIAQAGIQEPLVGVIRDTTPILLDGFQRARCARTLHLHVVPFASWGTDEVAGILQLLRADRQHALSLLEQARFVDDLHTERGLAPADIARELGRSPAWVTVRLGLLRELSPVVRDALFAGAFPVYAYLYTLRPFRRLRSVTAADLDQFIGALRGHRLSVRQIEGLAHGFFRGPPSFRQELLAGHLTWALQHLEAAPRTRTVAATWNASSSRTWNRPRRRCSGSWPKVRTPNCRVRPSAPKPICLPPPCSARRPRSCAPCVNSMITPDKRKALFVLHQQGLSIRQMARQLAVSRQAVRRAIAQQGSRRAAPLSRPWTRSWCATSTRNATVTCSACGKSCARSTGWTSSTRRSRVGCGSGGSASPWPPVVNGCPTSRGPRCSTTPALHRPAERGADQAAGQPALPAVLKRRYLQFYRVFDRFRMKCFLHRALVHWAYAPPVCVIDNTNLARWRGLGAQAVMVPEMEAFAKTYGFRFLCHARGHSDRKAGEERSFSTVETNFLPGRTFENLADLNRQALDWSTVRMEQRPQGKAGLIPAQAFEHEVHFLQPLPPYLPAPYLILERSVDEYGYVAVDANYYWVPGTGRGRLTVLRYEDQLQIYVAGQLAIQYALAPDGVRNQQFDPPDKPAAHAQPRHRPSPATRRRSACAPWPPRSARMWTSSWPPRDTCVTRPCADSGR